MSIEVFGVCAIRLEPGEAGCQLVRSQNSLPLAQIIAQGGNARFSDRHGLGWLQSDDRLLALPPTPEAVTVALDMLQDSSLEDERRWLLQAQAGALEWPQFRQLYRDATGKHIRGWKQARALPGSEAIAMLRLAAQRQAGPDEEPWQYLYDLLCRGLPHRPPFITLSGLQADCERLLTSIAHDGDTPILVPRSSPTLDVAWRDASRRVIARRDHDGHWDGVEIQRVGGPRSLSTLHLDHHQILRWSDDDALHAWFTQHLTDHPPGRSSRFVARRSRGLRHHPLVASHGVFGRPRFVTTTSKPRERVLAQFWPQVGDQQPPCRLFWSGEGEGGEPSYEFTADYKGLTVLRQRAAQLQIRGRSRMNEQELRYAIAQEAAKRRPARTLADLRGGGAFVRTVSPFKHPACARVDRTLTGVESVVAHTSGVLLHEQVEPQPFRLGETVEEREIYRPRSPFL